MGSSKADEMILVYNDVVLRRSDLHILSGPNFLNDRIIEFYFSHLGLSYPSDGILRVPPSIAFWIGSCSERESLDAFLEPLNLGSKSLVFFPVNDNMDVTLAEGGSHWSLLVFERRSNLFVHHDSHKGANKWHAQRLYESVAGYMGSSVAPRYVECARTPQQVNGYDCGLYVCAVARAICSWHASDGYKDYDDENGLWFSDVMEQVIPSRVTDLRSKLLVLIESIISAKQRAKASPSQSREHD